MSNTYTSKGEEKHPECASAKRELLRSLELNAWLAVCSAVYVLTLYLVRHHPDWSPGWKSTVSLMPIMPGLLYLRKGMKFLQKMDELQRRIQLEAWLFAAIGTVILGTIINVFNAHGFYGRWPAQGLLVGGAYMTMFILWCIGVAIANFRYR